MNRRDFVQTLAASAAFAAGQRTGAAKDGFPLIEVSILELQNRMTSGATSSRRLVDQYISRIEALDRRGPRLGHVIEINPDARAIADELDRERKAGRVRGPLHGIPILLKDNIATSDRMQTTAGSLALVGAHPIRDSGVARQLRAAGVVILGKTNLSEWANFRSSRPTHGWSGRGGQTRNPYAIDHSPLGSSSGSAVAAASSSAAASVGTETSGSIVSPSSACSVVGIKPTVGLISRAGIIPISQTQDTAGPIARTVADAAALLTALAGSDPLDPATADADRHKSDYTLALKADGLRGARLGILRNPGMPPKLNALYDRALAALRACGAELVEPAGFTLAIGAMSELFQYEFKAGIERYLAEWAPSGKVKTLEDIITFNRREAARELAYFGQETLEAAATKGPLSSPDYVILRERAPQLARDGMDRVLSTNRLDALVALTRGPTRAIDLVNGDPDSGGGVSDFIAPAAAAGYPHITVPIGYVHGLPVGMSFCGPAWSEAFLIQLAYSFELATQFRQPPTFAPTAETPWSGIPEA